MTMPLTDQDLYLFNEGSHLRLYRKLGAHRCRTNGVEGVSFAVWAPDAEAVFLTGDFNGWSRSSHPMRACGVSGIWELFAPGIQNGAVYKYHIVSRHNGYRVDKADPFAAYAEVPPKTGSVVWDSRYAWADRDWMSRRRDHNALDGPISVYELHLESWMRAPDEGNRPLTYRELAPRLVDYVRRLGFTHVELMPVMEYPFSGSWGYQTTGYFAPTSRFGTPDDFAFLVDSLHQNGIGVYLDWVPSHFPSDQHGLSYFDGTHLFEHADPQQGYHPDWGSLIFNYGRNEVRSFLMSSAFSWLDRYHIDGLRVDAVASMLYLDYSRKEGEWIPNKFGGRENLEAISFLKRLNEEAYAAYPDIQMIAEESTAWGGVSRPTYCQGLGFSMKWNMGWMHDTLDYFSKDPVHRKFHQDTLTFSMLYAFTEIFMLPLSLVEFVHGTGSLLGKMPGDDWQKYANLRLLFGTMFAQPGKKLLFMGDEIAQWDEWDYQKSVDWHLLQYAPHAGIQQWVADLNRLYRKEPALHALDFKSGGFEWIVADDGDQSVLAFLRKGRNPAEAVLAVCNFTPVPRTGYRIGVPRGGIWKELLNSDAPVYGGSGWGNLGGVEARPDEAHGRPYSLGLSLPPLSILFLKG